MSKFLADENFPIPSVYLLRNAGYEVNAVVEDSPGIEDTEVMARAAFEKLVVLTFDREYGELIFHRRLPIPLGIIHLRFVAATPEEAGHHIAFLHCWVMTRCRWKATTSFSIKTKSGSAGCRSRSKMRLTQNVYCKVAQVRDGKFCLPIQHPLWRSVCSLHDATHLDNVFGVRKYLLHCRNFAYRLWAAHWK